MGKYSPFNIDFLYIVPKLDLRNWSIYIPKGKKPTWQLKQGKVWVKVEGGPKIN